MFSLRPCNGNKAGTNKTNIAGHSPWMAWPIEALSSAALGNTHASINPSKIAPTVESNTGLI
jgi:hypothetical protein